MPFNNQNVLITGGSSGIGLATARLLSTQGANIWILSRNTEKLHSAVEAIRSQKIRDNQKFGYAAADVSDRNQVAQAIQQVIQEAGAAPDILINSAGNAHPGYVQELDLDIYKWLIDVNYLGTVYVTKAVLPGMLERHSGHIVNLSSMAGFLGVFGYTAYGATKYAVRGFSDAMRAELKPQGIHVSVVFPPDTDTPELAYENQFKPFETRALSGNAGVLQPETVAKEILKGIEHKRYIILPGSESKQMYFLSNLLGNGIYPVMDYLIGQAQRKKPKS